MAAVEKLLDVSIQNYVMVDFIAFTMIIDELGGIGSETQETDDEALDEDNEIFVPITYTLSSELTLNYARAFNEDVSEYERMERHKDIFFAVREKALQIDYPNTLIADALEIYEKMSDGIETNLSLQQVAQMVWLAAQVPEENILWEMIGPQHTMQTSSIQGLGF